MHGSKCLVGTVLFSFLLIFAGCASSNHRNADCDECLNEYQAWDGFSWNSLKGNWRGSLEVLSDDISYKHKKHTEQPVHISFESGSDFLAFHKIKSCGKMPTESIVFVGQVWNNDARKEQVYEVFGKQDDDRVGYGRVVMKDHGCEYQKLGYKIGMNRLGLPDVTFTQIHKPVRVLASAATRPFTDVDFEFLNFEPERARKIAFHKNSRLPASVAEQDKPPLMFRIFVMDRNAKSIFSRGKWQHEEEHLYRLWRVQ